MAIGGVLVRVDKVDHHSTSIATIRGAGAMPARRAMHNCAIRPDRTSPPADTMRISHRRFADTLVAAPVGHIDHPNAQRLESALAPLLAEAGAAKTPLVLDFERVEYISSMGLRVLMVAAKEMRSHGARIAVASLSPDVAEILAIARFGHVVDVFASTRDALHAVSPAAAACYDANAS
jgi:anti-anti-sigma factor